MTTDMKLDSVPPSLISFLSRQIIGSGFELYKKAVASATKGDEDFGKALKDTLYVQIREGLNHENILKMNSEPNILELRNLQTSAMENLKPKVYQLMQQLHPSRLLVIIWSFNVSRKIRPFQVRLLKKRLRRKRLNSI